MRTAVLVALVALVAVAFANPVAQQQKDESRRHQGGMFCNVCKDVCNDGLKIGASYNINWLHEEVKNKCAHELVFDKKCKQAFNEEMDKIDTEIKAGKEAGYICIDTDFC